MNEEIGDIVVGEPMKEYKELLESVRLAYLLIHRECIHLQYMLKLHYVCINLVSEKISNVCGLWGLDLPLMEENIITLALHHYIITIQKSLQHSSKSK